jgi:hypothetical protein
MSSSKNIDLQRDFAAGVYLSEAQNPHTHPSHTTLYTCTVYVYKILIHTGKEGGGGRVEPEIRKGATVHKAG